MQARCLTVTLGLMAFVAPSYAVAGSEGNVKRGEKYFRACITCHSLEPGVHGKGPSLAGMWGRKAGTAEGYTEYSDAMKSADVVWDAKSLEAWLHKPSKFIPRTRMSFYGVPMVEARQDLIAYLEAVTKAEAAAD